MSNPKSNKQEKSGSNSGKSEVKEEDKATTEQPAPTSDKAKTEGTAAPPEPNE